MSKQLVYWVTRGYQLTIDDEDTLTAEQYKQAIKDNGVYVDGVHTSLESIEKESKCVHFESDITEENDISNY